MAPVYDVLIVGGGIFGVSAANELQRRGYRTALMDPGPLPHPLAASTDISKVVRIEYGSDKTYARLAEEARGGWLAFNEQLGETLYHEDGILMLTSVPMAPGSYEYENYRSLQERGFEPERLDSAAIAARFPAFNANVYIDGYFHREAGYVESGRAVAALLERAAEAGVALLPGRAVTGVVCSGDRVEGVRTAQGEQVSAGHVVVATGAWTPYLLPELQPVMRSVGMPVFHLKPDDLELFRPPQAVVFSTDVTRTGWYGFPLHPREGVVKIANHGPGIPVDPRHDERTVREEEGEQLRAFLREAIPALASAPIVYTRRCLYCDTRDEHFWIDSHPQLTGLTVAAGGSGHAFKFGPVLGELIADAVAGRTSPRFRWRTFAHDTTGEEASRYREST